jgi:hypothetical protein
MTKFQRQASEHASTTTMDGAPELPLPRPLFEIGFFYVRALRNHLEKSLSQMYRHVAFQSHCRRPFQIAGKQGPIAPVVAKLRNKLQVKEIG